MVDGLGVYLRWAGPGRLARYREMVVDRYIVVYPVRRDRVLIVRVWHGAQKR